MRSFSRRLFLAATTSFAAGVVLAQTTEPLRTIPPDARRGRMTFVQGMDVTVDGRPTTLAPGVLIRDTQNLLVVPAAIPAEARVAYQVNIDRQIDRVWLLTDLEASRAPAAR